MSIIEDRDTDKSTRAKEVSLLKETLSTLRGRMTWTSLRTLLHMHGLPTGQGYLRTLAKIDAGTEPLEGRTGRIQDALVEHLLCGMKFTKLYEVDKADLERLQNFISSLEPEECPAASHFPLALSEEELLNENSGTLSVVGIQSNDDGIGVVLSSVYKMRVREEIEFDDFEDPEGMRSRFDEVVGVKFKPIQLFHTILAPHHRSQLEIRSDFPHGMREHEAHTHQSVLKGIVADWGIVHLDKPVNLFPAVRRFYDDGQDGIVTDFTFSTTTASIKHERMMRRGGTAERLDQRREAYHLAGKEGLETDIRLFRITVEWPKVEDNLSFSPSITLAASGPSGAMNAADPIISGVLVENCIRAADYEFAIERLGIKVGLLE
ncbi:MAG: hypothetical protein IE937_09650 [Gammaproteobacteria bacterium]|nr:hypothetical protein [Gammaproteobacteria bacterium]